MNGTGYDYAYSQFGALESLAQSLNEQQARSSGGGKQQQQQGGSGGYSPVFQVAGGSGPEAPSYDPTLNSNNAAAQHRLLMASVAQAYGQAPNAHHIAGSQQHANLSALFSGSPNALALGFQNILQQEHQRQQQAAYGLNSQQAQQQVQQLAQATRHARQSSLDELLLMHPNLLAPVQDPFPSLVISDNPQLRSGTLSIQPPVVSSMEKKKEEEEDEFQPWMEEIKLEVPSLALQPLSGDEVIKRIRANTKDVLTRYIPCVDFLVQCQQELRKGLEYATQRQRFGGRRRGTTQNMTPAQFFSVYVDQLPRTFYNKNFRSMNCEALEDAYQGLQKLRQDAKNSERQGCEAVKSNFLGGMKDGESWGLRKWLSKHGNALKVCTDLELILNACKKLDRSANATKKLAALLRPMSKSALDRLRNDIPSSYQQRSTAHPYLPFFHRLEAALRGMANFDPEEDDVICLDDSDDEDEVIVEEVKSKPVAAPSPSTAPAPTPNNGKGSKKRKSAKGDTDAVETAETVQPPKRRAPIKVSVDTIDDDDDSYGKSTKLETIQLPQHRAPPNNVTVDTFNDDSSSGESDTDSVVEIVQAPTNGNELSEEYWNCCKCSTTNPGAYVICQRCGEEVPLTQLPNYKALEDVAKAGTPGNFDCDSSFGSSNDAPRKATAGKKRARGARNKKTSSQQSATPSAKSQPKFKSDGRLWPTPIGDQDAAADTVRALSEAIDQLANVFEENQDAHIRPPRVNQNGFWRGCRYAEALRLFSDLMQQPEAIYFLQPVDDTGLIKAGNPPYSHVIKHPLCFEEIVYSLLNVNDEEDSLSSSFLQGFLPSGKLPKWNMWNGLDLLQAIDLVLLNSLAYGKIVNKGRCIYRSNTNKLRKELWAGINQILKKHFDNESDRKQYVPTRRAEGSGFVVYKINES